MKRRSAIRNLAMIAGGSLLLPACNNTPANSSIRLKNIQVTADQEKLLAAVASAIIPKTDTPGASEVAAHLYVMKMLDDMYEKDVQQNFLEGLRQLETNTKKRFGNSFNNCTADQQQKMLLDIESRKGQSRQILDFYGIMKQRTKEGYLSSEYVLRTLLKYELIPTHKYDGCYPVKNL